MWRHLQEIPYGETISYRNWLAVGIEGIWHAYGISEREESAGIVIPYHRVIAGDGTLGGFGGGLPTKQTLLALEQGTSSGIGPSPASKRGDRRSCWELRSWFWMAESSDRR